MKCLCTGSSGFIGKHVVKELERRGHTVKQCDHEIGYQNLTVEDLKDIDWVFHLGASSGSLHFLPTPMAGVANNCSGVVQLLETCKNAGVKKFIMSSTGSSYSNTPIPHNEATALNCPNFYTATKIFDEHSCRLYKDLYGLETVILRYASVYGDNEDSKLMLANVVSQFIWTMMRGEQPEIWGSGHQTRDFVFVDDVVSANIFAAENLVHGVYNVGTGVETTFNKVVDIINKHLDSKIEPLYMEPSNKSVQKRYVSRQLFDTNKLFARGWHSTVSVDDGIKRIINEIRNRPDPMSIPILLPAEKTFHR